MKIVVCDWPKPTSVFIYSVYIKNTAKMDRTAAKITPGAFRARRSTGQLLDPAGSSPSLGVSEIYLGTVTPYYKAKDFKPSGSVKRSGRERS